MDLLSQLELARRSFRITFEEFDRAHDLTFVDKVIKFFEDKFAISDQIGWFNLVTRELNLLSTIELDDLVDLYQYVIAAYDEQYVISPDLAADWYDDDTLIVTIRGETFPFKYSHGNVFGIDYLTKWMERKLGIRPDGWIVVD